MRKKIISIIAAASAIFALAACGVSETPAADGGLNIVVTTDALYEITSAIGGDKVAVTNITGNAEPHDFEPKPRDIETLQKAELFVYNGFGLDSWGGSLTVKTSLAAAEAIAVPIELGEDGHHHYGDEEEFEHDHNSHEGHLHDPHVWLSPDGAAVMARAIFEKLAELDAGNADYYEANYLAFEQEMYALKAEFEPQFAAAKTRVFVTGHAALGYLARDFGLEQRSVEDAFASGEPTAKQLAELAAFCNESGIRVILAEAAASKAVSETLARECGAEVATVYTMERAQDGLSFTERMRHNLETVLSALNAT